MVSAVAWSPDCTLMSCADDKILCKWGPDGEVITKITSLAVYVTSISWLPAVGKQVYLYIFISIIIMTTHIFQISY